MSARSQRTCREHVRQQRQRGFATFVGDAEAPAPPRRRCPQPWAEQRGEPARVGCGDQMQGAAHGPDAHQGRRRDRARRGRRARGSPRVRARPTAVPPECPVPCRPSSWLTAVTGSPPRCDEQATTARAIGRGRRWREDASCTAYPSLAQRSQVRPNHFCTRDEPKSSLSRIRSTDGPSRLPTGRSPLVNVTSTLAIMSRPNSM